MHRVNSGTVDRSEKGQDGGRKRERGSKTLCGGSHVFPPANGSSVWGKSCP